MTVIVRKATEKDGQAWDAFVQQHPDATFFHRFGWRKVLQDAFGHNSVFLLAEERVTEEAGQRETRIAGILPLAQVRSRLFGNKLASLPFCVYGGIVAASAEASDALREAACELARELNVEALELRNTQPSTTGWPVKELYYTFRKDISADNEANMKAIPAKQRAMVRKGIAAGLVSEEDAGCKRFYRVYAGKSVV